jgi:hypothetical protein
MPMVGGLVKQSDSAGAAIADEFSLVQQVT